MKNKKGIEKEFIAWLVFGLVVLGIIITGIWLLKKGKLDFVSSTLKNMFRLGGGSA